MGLTHDDICKLVLDARQTTDQRKRNHAYQKLLEHVAGMTNYVFRRTCRRLDADEAISESYMSLMFAVEDYDLQRPFNAFYAAVLRNKLQNITVRERADKRRANLEASRLDMYCDEEGNTYADLLADRRREPDRLQRLEEMTEFFKAIKPSRLEWLTLKSVCDRGVYRRGYEVVADELGVDLKTIDNALHRLRRKALDVRPEEKAKKKKRKRRKGNGICR